MATAQVVNNNCPISPIQDYVYADDQTQTTYEMTPGLKLFTVKCFQVMLNGVFLVLENLSNERCVLAFLR